MPPDASRPQRRGGAKREHDDKKKGFLYPVNSDAEFSLLVT